MQPAPPHISHSSHFEHHLATKHVADINPSYCIGTENTDREKFAGALGWDNEVFCNNALHVLRATALASPEIHDDSGAWTYAQCMAVELQDGKSKAHAECKPYTLKDGQGEGYYIGAGEHNDKQSVGCFNKFIYALNHRPPWRTLYTNTFQAIDANELGTEGGATNCNENKLDKVESYLANGQRYHRQQCTGSLAKEGWHSTSMVGKDNATYHYFDSTARPQFNKTFQEAEEHCATIGGQ